VIDGFGERTRRVSALLRAPETTFLVVTSPEPEPAREARFLARRLAGAGMSKGALIVNRVQLDGLHGRSAEEVRELLAPDLGEALAGRVAGNLADFDVLARRDAAAIAELREDVGEKQPVLVPQLDGEVQDLLGLSRVAEHLFA
jgi:anion-transporting  ArsA/GET3 family ATPase